MENNIDILKAMQSIKEQFTPEYFENASKNSYKYDREYPECFSNWYPHIVDFGYFKHADIVANQIFTWEETELMEETDRFTDVKWDKINEILKPTLDKMQPYKLYNIKNGAFSNKFEFEDCLATKENLAQQLWKINYASSMFSTGGYTELVVREIIPTDIKYPTIYKGMPLREELRVFYNMETKQIEYMVDYWDYDYCYKNLHDETDKIIFNWFHNKYTMEDNCNARNYNHKRLLEDMQNRIKENINTLKFDTKLKGIWSIDFLLEGNDIYLIDMARGFRSAYWNIDNLTEETRKEIENANS